MFSRFCCWSVKLIKKTVFVILFKWPHLKYSKNMTEKTHCFLEKNTQCDSETDNFWGEF